MIQPSRTLTVCPIDHFDSRAVKQHELNGRTYELHILDTAAGDSFYRRRGSKEVPPQGGILMYSIIAQSTFNDLQYHYDAISHWKTPVILVGNKCDLEDQRVISSEHGEDQARRWGCHFIETSAKAGLNVTRVFDELIPEIERSNPQQPPSRCLLM
eukprot:TRINITY_DN9454_c0_g1_i1.p1 TRINITY_DN9454_c0_g1~~TRINITY_DN9454_c0_g1_i1.p1  ORF type:complete len:156 (+),score=9.80 TRINITY_DN9454_c0_g1_i1:123-590(+)